MATIRLYGSLSRFANSIELDVTTVNECIQALCSQIDGFRKSFANKYINIKVNNRVVTTKDFATNLQQEITADSVIHISPKIHGAGGKNGGIIQAVIGVVLIVAGAYFGQPWLVQMGVGLMLGGVVRMLTKPPSFNTKQGNETLKQKNTSFSNLDNVIAQGQVLPIIYGTMRTGSRVISVGSSSFTKSLRDIDVMNEKAKEQRKALETASGVSERPLTDEEKRKQAKEEQDRREKLAREEEARKREEAEVDKFLNNYNHSNGGV